MEKRYNKQRNLNLYHDGDGGDENGHDNDNHNQNSNGNNGFNNQCTYVGLAE